MKTQHNEIRRLNEELGNKRTLVRRERAGAEVTEKLIRDLKQNWHQLLFALYEILLVSETADEKIIEKTTEN